MKDWINVTGPDKQYLEQTHIAILCVNLKSVNKTEAELSTLFQEEEWEFMMAQGSWTWLFLCSNTFLSFYWGIVASKTIQAASIPQVPGCWYNLRSHVFQQKGIHRLDYSNLSFKCLALAWVIWPLEKSNTSSLKKNINRIFSLACL